MYILFSPSLYLTLFLSLTHSYLSFSLILLSPSLLLSHSQMFSTEDNIPVRLTFPDNDRLLVGNLTNCMKSPTRMGSHVKKKLCYDTIQSASANVETVNVGNFCMLSSNSMLPLTKTSYYVPSTTPPPQSSRTVSPYFYVGDQDESSMDSIVDYNITKCVSPTPYNSPQHQSSSVLRSTPYPWSLSELLHLSTAASPSSSFMSSPNISPIKLSSPIQERDYSQIDGIVSYEMTHDSGYCSSNYSNGSNSTIVNMDEPIQYNSILPAKQRRCSSLCIEEREEDDEEFGDVTPTPGTSPDSFRTSLHGNMYNDRPMFKRSSSLPILSSPIPHRKLYDGRDTRSSKQNIVNFDKSGLLGSFEESILKDRFTPSGSIPGFKFKISASGLFTSPPATLPFTSHFYTFSDVYCPSPYTGHVKLDQCGTHGYQISKQGRIQATILDPENSVIRLFLIPYDIRDMPPRSQTFIRHRVYAFNKTGNKTLQYLVNIRIMSG